MNSDIRLFVFICIMQNLITIFSAFVMLVTYCIQITQTAPADAGETIKLTRLKHLCSHNEGNRSFLNFVIWFLLPGREDYCPGYCTHNYVPICATNGKTYINECTLRSINCDPGSTYIGTAHEGECSDSGNIYTPI